MFVIQLDCFYPVLNNSLQVLQNERIMKKQIIFIITGLLFCLNPVSKQYVFADGPDLIDDGPYFYFVQYDLKARWIENNTIRELFITQSNFEEIKKKFSLKFSFRDLRKTYSIQPSYRQYFKSADSIAVITDIHGEYQKYINLLKANRIIDKNLDWNFGTGHLVVLGDIFDRGDMVTEILWHLFGLEKQADLAGGMVHVLLGNHELMELVNINDYLNNKYKKVESLFNISYSELFSENTVLGKWLRSKPVIMSIDKILFAHAGISMNMIENHLKIKQINQLFSTFIIGKDPSSFAENDKLRLLDESNGPVWYRGYFDDRGFTESRLDSILNFYGKTHIVVGHTTDSSVRSLFHNKVFAADAGIGSKQPGQILMWKNGKFYRCFISGERTLI